MSKISDFQKVLGYSFREERWIVKALTHTSIVDEHFESEFERLEFLGDRVLGLALSDLLFAKYSSEPEGDLAKRLAVLASRDKLLEVAEEINITGVIRVYRADVNTRSSVMADAVEALLGAVLLDSSYEQARQVVERLWTKHIEASELPPRDPKTTLQEWVQAQGLPIPKYSIIKRTGPDHEPEFLVELMVNGQPLQQAIGPSKRKAEQAAAEQMLKFLGVSLQPS